uniref:Coiled-coil domain containing 78 n=1 Tax=Acanthochromis polyacanthus TaxID=80966 RepID=A0A3Q1FLW4_9TELE
MDAQHQQPTLNQLQDRVQALTQENLHLRDNNERLFTKVGYLESRLGHLASSNTDLSCRLVQSEEERLKISKELVEEKIQTNKMREQYEEETFELKNKILNQDGVITELQMQRDKLLQELQSAEARLKVTEKSGQDLTEDYATLKNSYLVLTEAHDKELAQSEELSAELLALARNQDALRRQLEEQQQSVKTTTQGLHGELDRVRALISRMSHNRVKVRQSMLLGNQDEIKETLEKMKNSYEEQQKKLEEKALVCSQSQMKEVEEENSKLQLQVKELHEEYRARLVCYLQDLADYIDGLKDSKSTSEHSKMRTFVDSMLQDVRSSYRAREEQLASAARSYKKRLQKITKTHHALLIAYRVQRAQILTSSETSLDPGPPEANFSLEPTELRDETEKELQQLRQDKARLEDKKKKNLNMKQPGQICEESWLDMKKQLREITDSTLRERALLVTRATVAEAQVMELQDYVDDHLSRYKQEITHLHRLHGMEEAGHSQSAHSSHH